jgi:hypothetical protein
VHAIPAKNNAFGGRFVIFFGMATASKPSGITQEITAKMAAQAAAKYLQDLVAINNGHPITVEETELSEDGKYWLITLGFVPVNPSLGFLMSGGSKEYKSFEISVSSGQVKSMKIRKL